jgi:hypothetical protein
VAAGSGLWFRDRGRRALKGLPGTWRLFAAEAAPGPLGGPGGGPAPTPLRASRMTPLNRPRGALSRSRRRLASRRGSAPLATPSGRCGAP